MQEAHSNSNSLALPDLEKMRGLFDSGNTRSLAKRREALGTMRAMIASNEQAIAEALYRDLHKSPEEAYATETGLLLTEIAHTLKHLARWTSSYRAKTNLVNLPSSSRVYRDPLGLILVIAPWNYPLQLALLPAMAAIAAGNCVVIKPSELAPATSALLAKIVSEYFDPALLAVAEGQGQVVIPSLMSSHRFDHVFYTGSTYVGKEIYKLAAEQLIPVTLELGGKSPVIIEEDADLQVAARRISFGKWLNAGQTCIAPDYVLVNEGIRDRFLDEMKICIQKFYTDDASKSYDYGRIINRKRFDTLVSFLDKGRIVSGGDHNSAELYIGPTIVDDIDIDDPVMKEEIFGPILPVISVKSSAEAMALVRKNPDPLALYLFTKNKKTIDLWMNAVSFGGGCINNVAYHFSNYNLPFGGVGNSGIGAYHGKYSMDLFSREKPVMKTPTWFDPGFKYPTLKGKLGLLKKIFK